MFNQDQREELVKQYFNQQAKTYTNHFQEEVIKVVISEIGVKGDNVILEVGSGSSDFTPFLLNQLNDQGRIYCLDIAGEMIKVAQRKLDDHRVTFMVGGVKYPIIRTERLTFRDN